ncbi:MAG TPA: DNA repair protein RecO [Bacteroidota bacterium]|nr:DNA repair protein RecO [Bacteroidota bacterium]
MLVSTDAIVLRSMKYGETSKIVTLYSKKFGKIKVIAKGARSAKSKFGASLEPMTHSSALFYKKEQRELHLLSKCEISRPIFKFGDDGDKLAVGLALVELVNQVMHDEEENLPMFSLLVDALEAVDRAAGNLLNIFFAFELRLLEIFGYGLDLRACARCGRDVVEGEHGGGSYILLASGSVMCPGCHAELRSGGIKASKGIVRLLVQFQSLPISAVGDLKVPPPVKDEILGLLQTYLQYHIAGVRTLKSLSLFTSL